MSEGKVEARLKALASEERYLQFDKGEVAAWVNGYRFGVSDIYTKLWVAKRRMLDVYAESAKAEGEETAYNKDVAPFALHLDMLMKELKPAER